MKKIRAVNRSPKRTASAFIFLLIVAAMATAQDSSDAERKANWERRSRIIGTEPRRPYSTLRLENINDEEVKEVQQAASAVSDGIITSISGVTASCACEEGPTCTAQVWVVIAKPEKSTGLMLSRIKDHWTLGSLQTWWLRYNRHQDKFRELPPFTNTREAQEKWNAWQNKEKELLDSFPAGNC